MTEADYAEVTERHGAVRARRGDLPVDRLVAHGVRDRGPVRRTRRWTRRSSSRLRGWLERYRMAGYDLEVDGPVFVPLEIGLHVCVAPGFFRSDVAGEVRAVLSDTTAADGRRGLFHPDRLTFGQPVYLSAVLAAVHSVPGVSRWRSGPSSASGSRRPAGSTPACSRWAASRSPGSTTTPTSPNAACST